MSDIRGCYCRGVNTCPDCEQHACTQCECDVDGAPAAREETTGGAPKYMEALNDWAVKEEAKS